MSRVQRFHGGVKIGATAPSRRSASSLPARVDVAPLLLVRPARPELVLAPLRLVVDVREPVLVDRDAAGRQLARRLRAEGLRDRGDVERKPARLEAIQQDAQPVVAPAGVVVAEEDRHLGGRGVERSGHGIEPSNHSSRET